MGIVLLHSVWTGTVICVPSFFFRLMVVLLDGLQRVLMTGVGPSCPPCKTLNSWMNDGLPSSVALLLSVLRASPFSQFAWWQHTRCFCLTSTMPRVHWKSTCQIKGNVLCPAQFLPCFVQLLCPISVQLHPVLLHSTHRNCTCSHCEHHGVPTPCTHVLWVCWEYIAHCGSSLECHHSLIDGNLSVQTVALIAIHTY